MISEFDYFQNATLLSETDNLRSNNQHISEQCSKLETQLNNLHSQNAVLQSHYSNLQEQNAKLQVSVQAVYYVPFVLRPLMCYAP